MIRLQDSVVKLAGERVSRFDKISPYLMVTVFVVSVGLCLAEFSAFGINSPSIVDSESIDESTTEIISKFPQQRTEVLVYYSNESLENIEKSEAIFAKLQASLSNSVLAGAAIFSNKLTAHNQFRYFNHHNGSFKTENFSATELTDKQKSSHPLAFGAGLRDALAKVSTKFNPKYHDFVLIINQDNPMSPALSPNAELSNSEIFSAIKSANLLNRMRFSLVSIQNTGSFASNLRVPFGQLTNVEIFQQITNSVSRKPLDYESLFSQTGDVSSSLASSYTAVANLAAVKALEISTAKGTGSTKWTAKKITIALTFFLMILGVLAVIARSLRPERRTRVITLEKQIITPLRLVKPGDTK